MDEFHLPPKVGDIANGSVTWQSMEGVDYELLGYFLSCHLIIEHYLEKYLELRHHDLDCDAARLTFGQKTALLTNFKVSDKYDCIPAIKHMNSLRNKLSHNVSFQITPTDLLPLTQYLKKVYETQPVPTEARQILSQFTTTVCVLFAGIISGFASRAAVQGR